jgi:hypothetical protein
MGLDNKQMEIDASNWKPPRNKPKEHSENMKAMKAHVRRRFTETDSGDNESKFTSPLFSPITKSSVMSFAPTP